MAAIKLSETRLSAEATTAVLILTAVVAVLCPAMASYLSFRSRKVFTPGIIVGSFVGMVISIVVLLMLGVMLAAGLADH